MAPNLTLAFAKHNHRNCSQSAMARAEKMAQETGLRLTPVRRRTLEILLEEHCALGAYEVLERLRESGFGHQPPVAYRALEFLVEHGLAHRVQRLNAFTACTQPGHDHPSAFLICIQCDGVAELSDQNVVAALNGAAAGVGFEIERMNIEAIGVCPACRTGDQT